MYNDYVQLIWKEKDGRTFETLALEDAVKANVISPEKLQSAHAARQLLVRACVHCIVACNRAQMLHRSARGLVLILEHRFTASL